MADVAARRVDVVAVYKVDRLTRSLSDFARIIEAFDKAGVSFVSITQAFNTTSSMGRLTLNILLSFAQFEREVTGERIRDKIAASKSKGLWMGGLPPLGYDPPAPSAPRILSVNEEEARTVRAIFRRFLEVESTFALQCSLFDEGVRSKRWVTNSGRTMGGCQFSRGALVHILRNRTYLGQTPHGKTSYPGQHSAIIDQQTFDAAQALLQARGQARRERPRRADGLLLAGRVFDGEGLPMKALFTQHKGGKAYSYYAGAPALPGSWEGGGDDAIRRVPTGALDCLVRGRVSPLLADCGEADDPEILRRVVARVEVCATRYIFSSGSRCWPR